VKGTEAASWFAPTVWPDSNRDSNALRSRSGRLSPASGLTRRLVVPSRLRAHPRAQRAAFPSRAQSGIRRGWVLPEGCHGFSATKREAPGLHCRIAVKELLSANWTHTLTLKDWSCNARALRRSHRIQRDGRRPFGT